MFKPGVSGNPGGRPKGLAALLRLKYGADAKRIVDELERLAFPPERRGKNQEAIPPRVRLEALRELLNRHSGKAPDMLSVDGGDPQPCGAMTFVIRPRG